MHSRLVIILSVCASSAQAREPALPVLHWPVTGEYRQLFPERPVVLEPLHAALPETKWDALLIYCDGRIEARDPATGGALWPGPVICRNQPQLLGSAAGNFIFATRHRVFGIDRESAGAFWQVGEEPPDDPAEDPEAQPAWTTFAMDSSRVFAANDDKKLFAIDAGIGEVMWEKQFETNVRGPLVANNRFVCFTGGGRRNRLTALDAATGEKVGDVQLEEDAAVQSLLLPSDRLLLIALSKSIHAFDLSKPPHKRWSAGCSDRFRGATLKAHAGSLYVSGDGRRVTKYDLATGRNLWSSPPIGDARIADEPWIDLDGDTICAARADTLVFLNPASGDILWCGKFLPGFKNEPPRLIADSILVLSPEIFPENLRCALYRIDRHLSFPFTGFGVYPIGGGLRRNGGKPTTTNFTVRDDAVILIDGSELIAYSARKVRPTRPAD